MGMFKDMKEMMQVVRSDELKELKRKADAQPRASMMDGLRAANEAMDQVPHWQAQGAAMQEMFGDPTSAGALYNNGLQGNATVNSITETGQMINNAPVCELGLTIQVPGKEPYQITHRQLLALSVLPRYQPGCMFSVRVDPNDPTKIIIG
jgi:hypothetical protein